MTEPGLWHLNEVWYLGPLFKEVCYGAYLHFIPQSDYHKGSPKQINKMHCSVGSDNILVPKKV